MSDLTKQLTELDLKLAALHDRANRRKSVSTSDSTTSSLDNQTSSEEVLVQLEIFS